MSARRSRGRKAPRLLTPGDLGEPAGLRLLPLPGDVGLVAARELRERLRGRVFRVTTLIVLTVVAGAIVIPTLLGNKTNVQRIGVVGALAAPLGAAVVADGPGVGTTVQLVPEPSEQAAESDLRGGQIAIAVVDGRQVLVDKTITTGSTSVTAQLVRAVSRTVGTGEALAAASLTPAQAATIAAARPLPVTSLQPAPPSGTQRATSIVGLVLVVLMLTQYNAWTLTGVIEEKSSRVVEVLLAAIRPGQLLAGKVLGIGMAAFVQAALAVVVALTLARSVHSDVLHGTTPATIAATLIWLVLGYAFYCWLYAAAGSMVERQDQVQSLAFPLSLPVFVGYILAVTTASSGNPSVFFDVLAYVPLTAPLAMPVLVGLGAVAWWQVAVSAVISIVCTVAVAKAAADVYRKAILRRGPRVRLREVLTGRAGGERALTTVIHRDCGYACAQRRRGLCAVWASRWITCA
jgi:ABC-2 type transport system permease protein